MTWAKRAADDARHESVQPRVVDMVAVDARAVGPRARRWRAQPSPPAQGERIGLDGERSELKNRQHRAPALRGRPRAKDRPFEVLASVASVSGPICMSRITPSRSMKKVVGRLRTQYARLTSILLVEGHLEGKPEFAAQMSCTCSARFALVHADDRDLARQPFAGGSAARASRPGTADTRWPRN